MIKKYLEIIVFVVISTAIMGCTKYFNPTPEFEEYEQKDEKGVKRKILFISIDGLVGKELEKKVPSNIAQLLKTSKYSFKALTDVNTSDASSWVSMMTGYGFEKHQVKDESYLPQPNSVNPHAQMGFVSSVILRLKQMKSSFLSSTIVQDEGIGNILLMDSDNNIIVNSDEQVKNETIKLLKNENISDLFILQFKDVLNAGVNSSFSASDENYAQSIENVDRYIGEILNELNNRESIDLEEWLIIVTSNHGGKGNTYGGDSFEERNVFSLYSYKDFKELELDPETMDYVYLNGYFPGSYSHYDGNAQRTFTELGVRAQSPAGEPSNVFNANSTPTQSISYDFKYRLNEDNFWAGLRFSGGYNYWYNYFLGKDAASNDLYAGWHLFGQDKRFKLRFQNGVKTEELEINRGEDGRWHHYSFIFEKVTDVSTGITVYLDGVLLANKVIAMGVKDFANNEPLTLGFNNQNTSISFAHYYMADFRVWNRALTDSEARSIACKKDIELSDPLSNNLIAHYSKFVNNTWVNSVDNQVPNLSFSNTAKTGVFGNYTPCDQSFSKILIQDVDIVPQMFYWLELKPDQNWKFEGEVFLSRFEVEFLK